MSAVPARAARVRDTGSAVVALEAVRCRGSIGDADTHLELSLSLEPAELVMVRTPRPAQATLLANLCAGLVQPAAGAVRFLGHDWSELDGDEFNALRSLTGRVFYRGNWLDHLSIAHNVLLPHLHHTRLPPEQLLAEAATLSRALGLPGLPTGEPRQADRSELQRAACVRAFLGAPRLLLLEHPTAGVYADLVGPLVAAVRAACDRGAAVLWMTPSERDWHDASIPATRRLRFAGRTLRPTRGGA